MPKSSDVNRVEAGLRKLVKEGRVSPASVVASPELLALGVSRGRPDNDGEAAARVAHALRTVSGELTTAERQALDVLLGLIPESEGVPLKQRRKDAAAALGIQPESFRVRREHQLLQKLAAGLVIELAPPRPGDHADGTGTGGVGPSMKVFVSFSGPRVEWVDKFVASLDGRAVTTRWSSVFPGSPFVDGFDEVIRECDFAVFIMRDEDATPSREGSKSAALESARSNVVFELGLAIGALGRDRIFVLVPRSTRALALPSDTAGFTYTFYEQNRKDEAPAVALRIWDDMRAVGPRAREARSKSVEVGRTDVIDLFADAIVATNASRDSYDEELSRVFRWGEGAPAKLRFEYADGGRYWLRRCQSPNYRYYHSAQRELSREAASLARLTREAAGTAAVDVVSLGCGDGVKDNILLRALVSQLDSREFVSYYPIEISDILLVEGLRCIGRRGLDRSRFRCKAVLGDFTNLAAFQGVLEARSNPKLFSVLGNTIGSFDERQILASLGDVMHPGDLVLFEANVGDPRESARVVGDELGLRWDLNTLGALGIQGQASDLTIDLVDGVSSVPRTTTVVQSATVSEARNSGPYRLSAMHHYDPDSLADSLEEQLDVRWLIKTARHGVVLLLGRRR